MSEVAEEEAESEQQQQEDEDERERARLMEAVEVAGQGSADFVLVRMGGTESAEPDRVTVARISAVEASLRAGGGGGGGSGEMVVLVAIILSVLSLFLSTWLHFAFPPLLRCISQSVTWYQKSLFLFFDYSSCLNVVGGLLTGAGLIFLSFYKSLQHFHLLLYVQLTNALICAEIIIIHLLNVRPSGI